jgi:50S ribosomal protein L16 3-hydroxylase
LPPGLSPAAFVARHWHKRALLMRGALPAFDDLFAWPQLRALAERDDVESRLVVRDGPRYTLARGPFRRATWRALPKADWTLLVQGTNLHDPRADRLLRRFDFLPFARLDDLMVSYATPGGGVGPHVDSYDVFLLQGLGRRRWRSSPACRSRSSTVSRRATTTCSRAATCSTCPRRSRMTASRSIPR